MTQFREEHSAAILLNLAEQWNQSR